MPLMILEDTPCDWCGEKLMDQPTCFDASIDRGSWGWLCERCGKQMLREGRIRLGLGRGQHFDTKTKQKLEG